jgi:hypothetical protein
MSLAERARLARAVGANAVIAPEALPDWAGRTVGAVWIGSTGAPARAAYLARRTFPADDMLVAATTLASEAFCPGEDAVVVGVGGVQSLGGGSVAGFTGPPHHRRFEVTSTGAGLVVGRQSFMHCWRARVDGRAAAVQPVNGAFCAVRVPDGRHLVEVFLDTTPYWLGAAGPILLGLVAALTRQAGSLRGRGGRSGATVRRNPR